MFQRKKLFFGAFILYFSLIFVAAQCFATTKHYKWKNFTKPLKMKQTVGTGIYVDIEVDLPENLIINSKEIYLLVTVYDIDPTEWACLGVNDQPCEKYHRLQHTGDMGEKTERIAIETKYLKPGLNIFSFESEGGWAFDIKEIRFDLENIDRLKIQKAEKPTPPSTKKDVSPPDIIITNPTHKRGIEIVKTDLSTTIEGQVSDKSGIVYVYINGKEASVDSEGNFTYESFLVIGRNQFTVEAMDGEGNKGFYSFTINRPEQQPKSAKSKEQIRPIAQRWAVIIGISKYKDSRVPALRYAAADAKSFYDWIVSPNGGKYAPSRVILLINEKATANNLKDSLFEWLKQTLEEDIVTIYFAGHGSPDSPDSPDNLFLLPYDSEYKRISATGFPMWDIETALKRFIRARKVVVIADACHSGGVGESFDIARRAERGIKVNPISVGLQKLTKVGESVCVISASDNSQFSQESYKWGGGHGVFTYFLLKGLQGEADYNNDNNVNLGELIPYLSEQVRRETKNSQSPTVAGKFDPALTIGR